MPHRRSAQSLDRRDILHTRLARARTLKEHTGSHWPVDHGTTASGAAWVQSTPRPTDHESTGHYHWRMRRKNLAKPRHSSGRVSTPIT